MSYRYIALHGHPAVDAESTGSPIANALHSLGMEHRGHVAGLSLFAPRSTPTFRLPDGGLVVGDLYDTNGQAVDAIDPPTPLSTHRSTRQQLLDSRWGEYLLIQPADDGDEGVTVMRDPSGGIGCAHSLKGGSGFITSDLAIASALGLYQERIDWDFVRHCLIYPHMKVARTGLERVSELLPGQMLTLKGETTCVTSAWTPWKFVMPEQRLIHPGVTAEAVKEAITMVVRAMATTDRSLLLELSGGLDSSIVGACLAGARARVACCTAVTPLPGADERQYADLIAKLIGVELLQQPLDLVRTDIAFALPKHSLRPAAWVLGHAVARIMDEEADKLDVRGHYSGSGGDTIFCYLTSAAPAADALRQCGMAAGCRAVLDLSRLHGCTVAKAARLTLRKLFRSPKPACDPDHSFLAEAEPAPLADMHPWFDAPANAFPGDRERIFDLAGNQMFVDATLRAGGRRVRMPLLSQPVMEACLRVPSWMWISGGRNRAIARSAFADLLPREVLERRSKGTFMNYTFGVYSRNKEAIRHFLLDGLLQSRGLVDSRKIGLHLDTQQPARDRSFIRIFDLCMIENWARNHD